MLKFRHYLKEELKLTFYLIILLSGLSFVQALEPLRAISWFSLLFFFFFHLAFGYYATRGLGKPVFIYIFMGGMFAEFMLSILFIGGWFYMVKPEGKLFVIPFLLLFAIYKTFSTVILMKYFNMEESERDN